MTHLRLFALQWVPQNVAATTTAAGPNLKHRFFFCLRCFFFYYFCSMMYVVCQWAGPICVAISTACMQHTSIFQQCSLQNTQEVQKTLGIENFIAFGVALVCVARCSGLWWTEFLVIRKCVDILFFSTSILHIQIVKVCVSVCSISSMLWRKTWLWCVCNFELL